MGAEESSEEFESAALFAFDNQQLSGFTTAAVTVGILAIKLSQWSLCFSVCLFSNF